MGERLSGEEVESEGTATQTPKVYQDNLCKKTEKLRENKSLISELKGIFCDEKINCLYVTGVDLKESSR